MNLTVKEYLKLSFDCLNPNQVRLPVVCKDGFIVSIQGGTSHHYCLPRMHCAKFEKVELGFPNMYDELIAEYAENDNNYTATVYGYVPIEIVEKLIEKHGGIVDVIVKYDIIAKYLR